MEFAAGLVFVAMAYDPHRSGSLEDIDRVCDEFERRYRAGESPRIEEFLGDGPAADQTSLVLELVAVDVCFRRSARETPAAADYVARFPQFGHHILDLFASESSESISRGMTMRALRATGTGAASTTVRQMAPATVGRYRLVSLLGLGGFGEVWKGIDTELQRTVAVKLMRADLGNTPGLAAIFLSEGRKLAQLRHPGVVTVFDVGQADGRCYLVSELIDGGTLAARFKMGAFAPSDAAQLVAKIADALHHAHLQ
jgi:serine/threonine-protein kinase